MSRKRTQKSVRASCDRLWSQIVRSRGYCEKCGIGGRLEAHHAYGRTDFRLRFEPRNGVALCHAHHRWAELFPVEFTNWFIDKRRLDAVWLGDQRLKGVLKRTTSDYLKLEAELRGLLEREAA